MAWPVRLLNPIAFPTSQMMSMSWNAGSVSAAVGSALGLFFAMYWRNVWLSATVDAGAEYPSWFPRMRSPADFAFESQPRALVGTVTTRLIGKCAAVSAFSNVVIGEASPAINSNWGFVATAF